MIENSMWPNVWPLIIKIIQRYKICFRTFYEPFICSHTKIHIIVVVFGQHPFRTTFYSYEVYIEYTNMTSDKGFSIVRQCCLDIFSICHWILTYLNDFVSLKAYCDATFHITLLMTLSIVHYVLESRSIVAVIRSNVWPLIIKKIQNCRSFFMNLFTDHCYPQHFICGHAKIHILTVLTVCQQSCSIWATPSLKL